MLTEETGVVLRAVDFACKKHKTQKRKDPEGTPYVNHPVGVCLLLWEAGVRDPDVLAAGLLHDTIEDTKTSPEEVCAQFFYLFIF